MPRTSTVPTRTPRTRRAAGFSLLLAFTVLAGPWLATAAEAAKPVKDEEIVVSGVVVDSDGLPVPGATVELRGRHLSFNIRDFQIRRRGGRILSAQTDASGAYEIVWIWHPYYNRFELVAGAGVGPPGDKQELLVLAETDLSKRMHHGSPVVATLEISNREPVDSLREFLALLGTEDEQRVYQELGKPDNVRLTTLPAYEETSWWYFERGKVYRFRNGKQESVDLFEPIPAAER